jgi:hypothetical protein
VAAAFDDLGHQGTVLYVAVETARVGRPLQLVEASEFEGNGALADLVVDHRRRPTIDRLVDLGHGATARLRYDAHRAASNTVLHDRVSVHAGNVPARATAKSFTPEF